MVPGAEPMLIYGYSLALIAPFLLAAILAIFGFKAGVKAAGFKAAAVALPVSLAASPMVQPMFLEARDRRAFEELQQRASGGRLVGRGPEAVHLVLGDPDDVDTRTHEIYSLEGGLVGQSKPRVVWIYRPTPLYWSGRELRVTFEQGIVAGVRSTAG